MDNIAAYSELSRRIEYYRSLGYAALLELVGEAPETSTVRASGEDITIELRVVPVSTPPGALRVEASAFGANWFHNERIDETITVTPPSKGVEDIRADLQ